MDNKLIIGLAVLAGAVVIFSQKKTTPVGPALATDKLAG
jgi:hypothetical protein